jgi:hypothetical protein
MIDVIIYHVRTYNLNSYLAYTHKHLGDVMEAMELADTNYEQYHCVAQVYELKNDMDYSELRPRHLIYSVQPMTKESRAVEAVAKESELAYYNMPLKWENA